MDLYCDIIRQRFVQGFRSAGQVTPFFTQNDEATARIYLLVPNPRGGSYPFMYDANSGKAGVTATATICNPGGIPLTLTAPLPLSNIKNGFDGTLNLATVEIATFLAGRAERTAFLAVEVSDQAGNRLTSFLGEIVLRSAATAGDTIAIPGVVRLTAVTGYTGGTPADLEGIVTGNKAVGTIFWVKINGAESHWEYVGPGSTPSDPDSGIILTTDGGQLYRTLGV
jgi:hypothetical protein